MDKSSTNQSWWQLFNIQVSAITCLPVLLIGKILCEKYGWQVALTTIFAGNAILLLIGIGFVCMVIDKRMPTIDHALDTFGKKGAPLFSILLPCSSLGWFAIQLNLMAFSIQEFMTILDFALPAYFFLTINIILGTILTLGMMGGMNTVKQMATISMLLMIGTLTYMLYFVDKNAATASLPQNSGLEGISLVIGFQILGLVDIPTFLLHAKNRTHGMVAIVNMFAIVIPLMMALGAYLFYITGGDSITDIMKTNKSFFWAVWITIFLLLGGWTTNNSNIHSAAVNSKIILGKYSYRYRVIIIGLLGTFIACLNPVAHLEFFLKILNIAIGSMGAVILSSYLLGAHRDSARPVFAWTLGLFVGLLTLNDFINLTSVPAFDAFITAYMVSLLLTKRNIYENNLVHSS